MRRRQFLTLLAAPALAPVVRALAPLVHVGPIVIEQRKIYARIRITKEMMDDYDKMFRGERHPVLIGPKPLIDAYNKLLAADERRFDWSSHSYRV